MSTDYLRDESGRFIEGNPSSFKKGYRMTEDVKQKLSISHSGKTLSEEHKQNIGLALKGCNTWSKHRL